MYPSHRVAYALTYGQPDPKAVLDHVCRIHGCVNPHHLDPVTNAENVRRGDTARLTSAQVAEIRSLWSAGCMTQVDLGRRFDINHSVVSRIVRGEYWKGSTCS